MAMESLSTLARTPRPGAAWEVGSGLEGQIAVCRRSDDCGSDGMLAAGFDGCCGCEEFSLGDSVGEYVGYLRFALGERAGLIEHNDVESMGLFEGLCAAYEDAVARAGSRADHDGGGRREAQGAGAGDDEDGDGVQHRLLEGWVGAEPPPEEECRERSGQHDGNEIGGDGIREALDGRFGALRLLHQTDDLGYGGSTADLRGLERERSGDVDGSAVDRRAYLFLDGQALAGEHRFVDGGCAFGDDAVGGDTFAGPDADGVAGANLTGGDVLLLPVADDAGGARLHT